MREYIEKIAKGKSLSETAEAELAQYIRDLYETHPNFQVKHKRWQKIIAWVSGYQSSIQTKTDLANKQKTQQKKIIFNRLRPFFRTLLAKLCSANPQLGVIPNTDEAEDLEAARIGDLLLEYFYTNYDFAEIRRTLFKWILLTNQAYLRVFWDISKKGLIDYERQVILDENGAEVGQAKVAVYEEGDVNFQAVSPFHCYPDPVYSDPDSWRWFIFVELIDAYDLAKLYKISPEDLVDEGVDQFKDLVKAEEMTDIVEGDEFRQLTSTFEDKYGKTILKIEFWTPEIYAIVAGTKLLEYGQNPYGMIPFFGYEDQLIPLDFGGSLRSLNDSVMRDLIPIQREYNRFVSLMSQHLEEFTKAKVLVPLNSLLDRKGLLSDQNITLVFYDPQRGGVPHQIRFDQIHPQTTLFKKELENELEFISGVHEVSFAQLPERASHASGTLVSLLLEQDDQTLDHLIKAVDKIMSKSFKLGLKIIQDNYNVSRIIKVVGRDKQVEIFSFKGSDLKGNTDVRVSTQLGLPRSRILRAEWILRLAQTGLIQDPKLILEMLEFGQARKLFEDILLHERKATRENMLVESNPDIDPLKFHEENFYDFDADDIHFKIHLRDRLSPKFLNYTKPQKDALELHLRSHFNRMNEKSAQAAPAMPTGAGQGAGTEQLKQLGLPADFLSQLAQQENLAPESARVSASGLMPE